MRKLLNKELGRKSISDYRNSSKSPFVVVLDNIRSHNNVGSVFRTADAFLTGKLYLCGITPRPPHRDIQKTALGATESVEWEWCESTSEAIRKLKDTGYSIIGVEQVEGAVELQDLIVAPGQKYALVFGHEVKGVSPEALELCDQCVVIPQFGTKHSFNIAVSAGIVLWEANKKGVASNAPLC
jgi:tRNA G18 (ribose-2'-O)-methylase SpoU